MINQNSVNAVDSSKFSSSFRKPLYDSYCFSRIPDTILHALSGQAKRPLPQDVLPEKKTYKKAVFLFVDAFGWKFFEKYKDRYPSLQRFVQSGVVSKLTSQFPSTTPVHATTINTGLEVGEHGVYEWFYFEPKIDEVIAPLLFSFAKDRERDTLKTIDVNPADIYPEQTFYNVLKNNGIKSYVFSSSDFAYSPFNTHVSKGAEEVISYQTLSQALTQMQKKLTEANEPSYFFFYYGKIDAMGHMYGPDSEEFEAELDTFFTSLERIFFAKMEDLKDTIILLSADHGQSAVSPENTIYINKIVDNIEQYFMTGKNGKPIVPAGSCRDMFLHVKDSKLNELMGILSKHLEGKAELYKTDQLINEGFFGSSKPSQEFLSRAGNLVILPYVNEAVWWYQEGVFEQRHKGHHGGLTKEEMEIPLLTLGY